MKGELIATNDKGEVVAKLSVSLLAQELLGVFGGYKGIAESARLLYFNAKSERTKVAIMQLVYQTVKVAEGKEPPASLSARTKEELDELIVEKMRRLAEQGPEAVAQALHMMRPELIDLLQQKLSNAETHQQV